MTTAGAPIVFAAPAPYGHAYRDMLEAVREVQEHYETLFPALEGKTLEITGFVWFQGWNDQFGELGPVVIGAMGQNGSKPAEGNLAKIQQAQFAVNDVPEYRGNVETIATDVLIDKAAEALYPTWRDNVEQWERTGSDFASHYLGSAIWFHRIGQAMGRTMLELLDAASHP